MLKFKFVPVSTVASVLKVFDKMVTKLRAIEAEQARRAAYFENRATTAHAERVAASNAASRIEAIIK